MSDDLSQYDKRENETEEEYRERIDAMFDAVGDSIQEMITQAQDQTHAWVALHDTYNGLRRGGFEVTEACLVIGSYLYLLGRNQ